ncbi:TPA: hypothetical protein VDW57_005764 [Pseudomonas aeruginosa]|nr:hypothetical protein [Pseudomonas aeruginosa]
MNRAISLPLKGAAWLLLVLALPFANAQDMNKTAPQRGYAEIRQKLGHSFCKILN